MPTVMRNLIEYNGIDNCPFNLNNFRQINVEYMLCIPEQKPDVEQIMKVWVKPCILHQEVVKTPKGTSLEGQNVTGYKLMVCGEITLKIEYVACDVSQSVYMTQSVFPFSGYVVLPENFNPNSVITTNTLVEDIHSEQLDLRCIYNNITMMIIADVC